MQGLDLPHHDGSERHVSTLEPELGDTVSVWLRVPHADPATGVWLRTTPDAEPTFVAAVVDRTTPQETWWRADLVVRNPLTHYRFLLDGGSGYRYVNGTGTHRRSVGDADDFRISAWAAPPSWLADVSFYEIFPDRFASSGADRPAPAWAIPMAWDEPASSNGYVGILQLFGGDLAGIEARLDHLVGLGIGAIYLRPFFPAPSVHRYDADTFDHVDPLLGGDDALVGLVKACHNRGLRIVGDLTINHTGRGHEWFRTAQADAGSPEAGFYHFDHHPDVYEAWYDIPTLPKLDLRSAELRRRLIEGPDSVTARWLGPPFDLDGWRVDVANMAGRLRGVDVNHAVAVAMRQTIAEARADAYLVAEHCYDASRDLDGDGWHGVMNYHAFTRPVWGWLRDPSVEAIRFLGDPVALPREGGATLVASMVDAMAAQPWRSSVSGFNLLGSYDTTRFRSVCGTRVRQLAGAGLLHTLPGVPMVCAGDELGITGIESDDARQPMPWHAEWDGALLDGYRSLGALRRSSSALRRGGLRWLHASDDVLVYLRESLDERVLVQVARAPHEPVVLDVAALDAELGATRHGADVRRRADGVELPADGPAVDVWQLEPLTTSPIPRGGTTGG